MKTNFFRRLAACARDRRLPYFIRKPIIRTSMIMDTCLHNMIGKRYIYDKSKKNLYASPVGKNGKDNLRKVIDRFGYEKFDYILFAYDDVKFDEEIFRGCRVIREKGFKWQFARKYLTPELCHNYNYIFFWDDDIDIIDFSPDDFIDIMLANGLEIAQPALSEESPPSRDITMRDASSSVGRFTDYVELMVPVLRSDIWKKFWIWMSGLGYDVQWGWSMDYYWKKVLHIHNMGIIDRDIVKHTRPYMEDALRPEALIEQSTLDSMHKLTDRTLWLSYMKMKPPDEKYINKT